MSKSGKATGAKTGELPFEEALGKLESIVEEMESDSLPLESLLARFEEGTRLVQHCQSKLAEAELKIQELTRDASGNLQAKPADLDDSDAAS